MTGDGRSAQATSPADGRLLVAFLAAALVLRLPGHLNSGLWLDEIWLLVETIRGPFSTLLTRFESDNNHPLYSVLAWIAVRVFGEHAWSLRLPAVLFGVASIGMLWRFSLRVAPRGEAALVTALMCLSYHHVWFSQNARGYTMLLFWTLAATYYMARVFDGGGRRAWVLYAVCLALATFTHSSAVLLGVAHAAAGAVVALLRPPPGPRTEDRWAPLIGVLAAGAISVVLHAGMLSDMVDFFTRPAEGAAAAVEGSEWTSLWWTISAVVQSLGVGPLLGYAALAGGGALVGLGTFVTFRRDWRFALLYLVPVATAVAAPIALGRSLRPRFLFHLGGFGLLIMVAGIFALCEWGTRLAPVAHRPRVERLSKGGAAALLLLASLAILPRAYALPKQDFEGALLWVEAARAPGEEVAAVGLTVLPYRSYYQTDFRAVATSAELDSLLAEHPAVYVLNTIPIFLESTAPDLAAMLGDSSEVARFRGSLGDGDVVVYRLEGRGL